MNQSITELKKLVYHKQIIITCSGNNAIFIALCAAKAAGKETVLIPSEGGWISYKTYPEILGMKVKEIKTKHALLDLEDLKKKADDKCCLLYNSLGAYIIEQDVSKITEICTSNNTLTINDCTGTIGTELCIGDILVCSFGTGKIIDAGYGGFISFADNNLYEKAKNAITIGDVHISSHPEILKAIKDIEKRRKELFKIRDNIRVELKECNILHKDSKLAVNVIALYHNESELSKITEHCKTNNYPYVLCPKYIKVNEKAVSVEVKKI